MQKCIFFSLFLLLLSSSAFANFFIGKFSANIQGETYYLTVKKSVNDAYTGTLKTSSGESYFEGVVKGTNFVGCAMENGNIFCFQLSPDKDNQILFQDQKGNAIPFIRIGKQKEIQVSKGERKVYINRVRLSDEQVKTHERQAGTMIPDGRYWYDAACGAWGMEGGATAGFIQPGLALPRPIPADISGGGTGIYINGREIHITEQIALQNLFGETYPGRYWLDAYGNLGLVGQPRLCNLLEAVNQAQQAQSGTITHGYDSTYGARGTLSSDNHYIGRTAGGKSVEWFPGMSDHRFKKQVAPLSDSLSKVKQLQGVRYQWRHDSYPNANFPHGQEIGLIAQDVEKVLPDVVHTNASGIKSIDYYKLVPLLIEAIKEQQKEIDLLQKRLEQE